MGDNRGERSVSSGQAWLPRNPNYFRRTLSALGAAKLSGRCCGFPCLGLRNGAHPGTWCLQLGSLPNANKRVCKTLCQRTLEERRWSNTVGSDCYFIPGLGGNRFLCQGSPYLPGAPHSSVDAFHFGIILV